MVKALGKGMYSLTKTWSWKALTDCVHTLLGLAGSPEAVHASCFLQFNAWEEEPARRGEFQKHPMVHCGGHSPLISLNAGEHEEWLADSMPCKD